MPKILQLGLKNSFFRDLVHTLALYVNSAPMEVQKLEAQFKTVTTNDLLHIKPCCLELRSTAQQHQHPLGACGMCSTSGLSQTCCIGLCILTGFVSLGTGHPLLSLEKSISTFSRDTVSLAVSTLMSMDV